MKSETISLDEERQAEVQRLEERLVDLSDPDAPEVLDWREAERGRFYRPVKQQITLRLDKDVIAWFKARGDRYQSRMNRALREHIRRRAEEDSEAVER